MFVDQPAGTGFSYVSNPLGYVTNERQVGTELWTLLQEFYKQHSKYSGLDLFIVGESYGVCVPSNGRTSKFIHKFIPSCVSLLHTCLVIVAFLFDVVCLFMLQRVIMCRLLLR